MEYEEAVALLGAPGGPFEVVEESFLGRPMRVFASRDRSLRESIQNAAVHGAKECLVYGERRITYAEFVELVWGAAHYLAQTLGLQKGDRLGVLAYNQPDWLITLFGAAAVGGVTVGLNGWWTSSELEFALQDADCRFLVVDEQLYPRVAPVLPRLPHLEWVIYIGQVPPAGTIPIAALLRPSTVVPTVALTEDDPFVLLYTSGTTGRSKGCITTHGGTIAQVMGIVYRALLGAMTTPAVATGGPQPAVNPSRTVLLTSPLFHVASLHSSVCTALSVGSKMVFGAPRFEPEATLQLMEREQVTSWMAIPTLLQRLIERPALVDRFDLSALDSISSGGAPMPAALAERARQVLKTKPRLSTTYGLTECHGMATSIGGVEYQQRPRSVGRPSPVVQVKICDELGNEVAVGEQGEVRLYGPTVTPGYWQQPEASAEVVVDCWLRTGDIGYVDTEGYLYISDRAKDVVIRGGENVYSVEVENCLAEHPAIVEAAILGVPDAELGERVKAVVRPQPGVTLEVVQVQAHVAARLAKFKVPEEVVFTADPLPRNPAGKVLKKLLREGGPWCHREEVVL